jgi:predicted nuclease of predicted toxin-antitoxin system
MRSLKILKLLCDENIEYEITLALQRAGFDALHIKDLDRRGYSDPSQLQAAILHNRILITYDRTDFLELNHPFLESGAPYPGIIIAKTRTVREVIRRLLRLIDSSEIMFENNVWYI